jgi:radical SAM superfamily enzyme with C-terminal helix-hairpin-helix motif
MKITMHVVCNLQLTWQEQAPKHEKELRQYRKELRKKIDKF